MIWPFGNNRDPEILIKELESPDPSIREKAFKELKSHPSEEADRVVLAAIQSYDQISKDVFLPLIDIAGSRQIEEALPVFKSILKTDDYQIRETIIQALAAIPTQDSLDILVSLLSDSDPAIKQAVHNIITEDFGKESLGALLRGVPADKTDPLYFEIVAIMEDLDLFSILKENFEHPDYRVKDFNFDNLAKFHRPDFIPLYLDFYNQASKNRKDRIIEILEEYSPLELLPHFKKAFDKSINDSILQLADHLIFSKFSSAKEEILRFAMDIKDNRYRTRIITQLLKQIDPFVFMAALELLNDPVAEIRTQAQNALSNLIKVTYRRLQDPNEPNKHALAKLYEQWEKHIASLLKDRDLNEEKRKLVRRLFYSLAQNKHGLLRPYLRTFFENNFQETYFVIREWPFDEQFQLFIEMVREDPSFAAMLLTVAQGNLDENLWRIILKLQNFLDEEDRKAFKRNLLNRNRTISLEQFLKDTDPYVRASAIDIASELKANGLIEILKSASKDPSPEVRLKALQCLSGQNYPQIQSILTEALNDPEEEIAYFAITQLKEILGSTKVAPYLARFINSSSEKIRDFALKEIAEVSKKRYKENFNNLKPEVRKLAAKVIQKIDKSFSDQIIQDLSSLDPQVRLQAARLLENIQIDSKGKDALLAAMKDPSKLVRAAVVKTLGVLGDNTLIKHLIGFFNDPDPRVRANTIEAISSLGDRQAIQILLPFLEDPNNRIRANAIVGISKIGHVNVIPVIQKMLADKNPAMQASALWALGEIGNSNFLSFVYPFLNNRDEMLRFNAIKTISRIKPEMLKPYLANLRQDPSGKIRKLVASLSYKVL
ncbi:MAG: hypothetical protein Kow0029_12630 [Candidatus Rifleibacteriota bacterium]